jgi:predicted nuclease with TOPRIM domain
MFFSHIGIITMTNPTIQTDIAEILKEIRSDQREILKEISSVKDKANHLEVSLETVKRDIKTLDQKLSGQIETLDQKLSGQIEILDTKVEQLDKRVGNQEFLNRGILIGLIVVILGGAAKFFGFVGNP